MTCRWPDIERNLRDGQVYKVVHVAVGYMLALNNVRGLYSACRFELIDDDMI